MAEDKEIGFSEDEWSYLFVFPYLLGADNALLPGGWQRSACQEGGTQKSNDHILSCPRNEWEWEYI